MGVIERVKQLWHTATVPGRLIGINVAVFVALRLAVIVCLLAGVNDPLHTVLSVVELPSRLSMLVFAPWTVATYMFAQYDVLHIIFNMLWLYWFGQVMLLRCTPAQLAVLYIYGGLAGGVLFLVAYNTLPLFAGSTGMLIGASASVMAIVTATAILMPDFRLRLLLIGDVKLKWIAVATLLLVLLGTGGTNAGGEVAHLGGIIAGMVFALNLKRGVDITRPVTTYLNRRRRPAPTPAAAQSDIENRRELDSILDKIRQSGYSALTPQERKRLFDVSRNIK
ncbi:MAG: rhomboid family intramembrane serine protease [Muribaculaceae bacterium]|nr:rhomboid family intramembrane serine protease [Muribaculaceae bacterium]